MYKMKKHSLLICILLLFFILIPFSFASDLNESNVINNENINVLSADEDAYIDVGDKNISVEEGEGTEIKGVVNVDGNNWYYDLTVECSYVDYDGVLRKYRSIYFGFDSFIFNTNNFDGLKVRDNPYVLSFNIVKDEYFEELNSYGYNSVVPATINLNITSKLNPTVPNYETFDSKGKIYVSSDGNDDNNGSDENPYATISKALDQNKALGGSYEIIVKSGHYVLSNYSNSANFKIIGRGKVIISSKNKYHLFLSGTTIVELNNLIFINGTGETSGSISASSTVGGNGNLGKVLNIINCTFKNNKGSVGVITTYARTTIIGTSFINNKATGSYSNFQGLISARDGQLNVNFCNFINNTVISGKPIIYSEVKANADCNFWGNNDGPLSSDVSSNVKINYWSIIVPKLLNSSIISGNNYIIDIEFKYRDINGVIHDLLSFMPELSINLESVLGIVDSNATIKNNNASINYKAITPGVEKINAKLNNRSIFLTTFEVDVPELDKIYVSTNGLDTNVGTKDNPLRTISSAILKNKELGGNKTIIILSGIYFEHDLIINNNVTIIGEKKGEIKINANNNGRIFVIDGNCNMYNLTFINGLYEDYTGGGAIYHNSGNLNIYNSIFKDNIADNGGAISSQCSINDKLGIYNSTFINNFISDYSSDNKGSAIYSSSKTIIDNCEFANNINGEGYGTVYIGESSNIINSKFNNNEANEGGAIYVDCGNRANVFITNNTFISNKAKKGGAIYSALTNVTIIENNTFNKNIANSGGAIYIYGFTTKNSIINNKFNNNSDDAIYLRSVKVNLLNNTIIGSNPAINLNHGNIANTILTFLNNETIKVKNGSIILNASVTDDMGNIINGGTITFISNGENIGQANVVNGVAVLNKEFGTGDYLISGTFSASNNEYSPLKVNNGLLRVNVKNYWFINETGYETLQEAIDNAKLNDVIMGIPLIYNEPIIQIGHRMIPAEPWIINKNITITSFNETPITLKAIDRYLFYIDYYSNVTFKNIIFTGSNNPNGWGGAIDSMGKNIITVENCTFKDNIAEKGAGIFAYGKLYITNSVFINNTATVFGGAIVKDGDGDFFMENVKFINNSAFTYAGAVDARGYSDVIQIFKNITFEGNSATCAGAVYTSGYNVTFINCNFMHNKAIDKNSSYTPLGGAVYVHKGGSKFINSNFVHNYAEGSGGALQLENSVLSYYDSTGYHVYIHWAILKNCTIENNTALYDGGAIATNSYASRTHVNITNTIIRGNTARNGVAIVNLYSFYTLNKVLIENNSNLDKNSSLIYTHGFYSFPESFYANTTIINSTFKNNKDYNVISSNTIYSTVNIKDSKFDGEGIILFNVDSTANLSNNVQINPTRNYSIENKGDLSLFNNIFSNSIHNNGKIITPTFIIVIGNQTLNLKTNTTFKLTARVADDNNNTIIGGNLLFRINNTEINSTLEFNKYVANYKVLNKLQIINATYDDSGLLNLTNKYGIIIGKLNLLLKLSDSVVYYKCNKFNFTLIDENNNPIVNVKVIVNIHGKNYTILTNNDGVGILDLDLGIGFYNVTIKFMGNDQFDSITGNSTIKVLSSIIVCDMIRGYNSGTDFKAIFLDKNGNPLSTTEVFFKVDNKLYSLITDSKGVAYLNKKLSVGKYTVISINPAILEEVSNKLEIIKRITGNKHIIMSYFDGSSYKVRVIGDDGKVVGAGQTITFKVNSKTYKIKTNKNGYATLKINLIPKTYKITAEYKGYKISNKIVVKKVLKASNISKKRSKFVKFSATLKNSKGKAIVGKKIIFKIKGKTYTAKTNKKGIATISIKNLKVGKHKIVSKYVKSTIKNTIKIRK